jgi:hypothetical protein
LPERKGWVSTEDSRVVREFYFTNCHLRTGYFDVHGIIVVCAAVTVESHDEGGTRGARGSTLSFVLRLMPTHGRKGIW